MMSSDPYFPVPTIRRDANSLPPITRDVSMAILLLPCSATHRPNHLDAVAILQPDGLELMAARDLAVHGDRGALALHAEGGEEAPDAEAVSAPCSIRWKCPDQIRGRPGRTRFSRILPPRRRSEHTTVGHRTTVTP